MTAAVQTQALIDAVCAILGSAAPAPGSPRYQKLLVDAGPILDSARADRLNELSEAARDALLKAVAADRRRHDSSFVLDAVCDGYHGARFASDEELLGLCADLPIEDIFRAAIPDALPGSGKDQMHLLIELSTNNAARVISQFHYDSQNPEMGLLGSLGTELDIRGLDNPFHVNMVNDEATPGNSDAL